MDTIEDLRAALELLKNKAVPMQQAIDTAMAEYRAVLIAMAAIHRQIEARIATEKAGVN